MILLQCKKCRFNPWDGKIPWRRAWQPTPVLLPGESHGQKRLVGYSPEGCRVRRDWSNWTCTQESENVLCGEMLAVEVGKHGAEVGLLHPDSLSPSLLFCLRDRLTWKTLKFHQNWICCNTKNVVFSHPRKLLTVVLSVTRQRTLMKHMSWKWLSLFMPWRKI